MAKRPLNAAAAAVVAATAAAAPQGAPDAASEAAGAAKVKTVRMGRHTDLPGPHVADVHPDEVEAHIAAGWRMLEPGEVPMLPREQMIARLIELGRARLEKGSDEDLARALERAELDAADEGADD